MGFSAAGRAGTSAQWHGNGAHGALEPCDSPKAGCLPKTDLMREARDASECGLWSALTFAGFPDRAGMFSIIVR